MIIDKLMSPAVLKPLAGLSVGTNVLASLDMGVARNNGLFTGSPSPGFIVTIKGGTSGGLATIQLTIRTDDNEAMTSATTLFTGTAIAVAATAGDGTQFFIPMPDSDAYEQFLAVSAVVGTAVFTGGTISVEYVADKRNWRAYPAETGR